MTVNELISMLSDLSDQGYGDLEVVVDPEYMSTMTSHIYLDVIDQETETIPIVGEVPRDEPLPYWDGHDSVIENFVRIYLED